MNGLYWEKWYNDNNMTSDEMGYIYYENKLLGVPRIRQLRVHSNSCKVMSSATHIFFFILLNSEQKNTVLINFIVNTNLLHPKTALFCINNIDWKKFKYI